MFWKRSFSSCICGSVWREHSFSQVHWIFAQLVLSTRKCHVFHDVSRCFKYFHVFSQRARNKIHFVMNSCMSCRSAIKQMSCSLTWWANPKISNWATSERWTYQILVLNGHVRCLGHCCDLSIRDQLKLRLKSSKAKAWKSFEEVRKDWSGLNLKQCLLFEQSLDPGIWRLAGEGSSTTVLSPHFFLSPMWARLTWHRQVLKISESWLMTVMTALCRVKLICGILGIAKQSYLIFQNLARNFRRLSRCGNFMPCLCPSFSKMIFRFLRDLASHLKLKRQISRRPRKLPRKQIRHQKCQNCVKLWKKKGSWWSNVTYIP